MANYGINGFGRIGRNVLRAMTQQQVERVRAINDLTDTKTLAHLLKWDSVHGKFDGEIGFDEENIIVRSHKIRIFKERDPGNLPWRKLDVDVVLESTGFFTARDKAELHISKAGAKRVLISAPAKNPDATLCIGINDSVYDPAKHTIVSNASCTTNCLASMAKVLHDKFGIAHGFMSTIHSYTNDQRILDFPHEDLRRARAASVKSYKGVLEYSDEPLVSHDIIGNPHSCIFDSKLTIMLGNRFVKVVGWYDNEWGYSNRCVEMLEMLGK